MMPEHTPGTATSFTRRSLLKGVARAGLAGAVSSLAAGAQVPGTGSRDGVIARENRNPGTTDWQLTFIKSKDFRSEMIEGYCSKTSVRPGEEIDSRQWIGQLGGH